MRAALDRLLTELAQRFARIAADYTPVKRVIKVKYGDFTQTTLEEMLVGRAQEWNRAPEFYRLLEAAWAREGGPVRLLGAGLRLQPRAPGGEGQLPLFVSPSGG